MSYRWITKRLACCPERAQALDAWARGVLSNPDRGKVTRRGRCKSCGGQAREIQRFVRPEQSQAIAGMHHARARFYEIFAIAMDDDLLAQYETEVRLAKVNTAAELDLLGLVRLGAAARELEMAETARDKVLADMPRPGSPVPDGYHARLSAANRNFKAAQRNHKAAAAVVSGIAQRRMSYQQKPELVHDEVDNPFAHRNFITLVDTEHGTEAHQANEKEVVLRNLRNDTFRKMFNGGTIELYQLKTGERLHTLVDIVSGSGGSLHITGMPSGGGNKPYVDIRAVAALELADVHKRARNRDAVNLMMKVAHGETLRELSARLYGNTNRRAVDEVAAVVRMGLEDAACSLGFASRSRYHRCAPEKLVWHNSEPSFEPAVGDWSTSVHPGNRPRRPRKEN